MEEAFRLIRAGDLGAAEAHCRECLEASPDDVNLLGLLGAILLKNGALDESEAILRRTTELEPAFAKPHEDLGALYLEKAEPERAVACFERALELDPGQTTSLRGLYVALERAGRTDDALALKRRYTDSSPEGQLLAEAEQARKAGDGRRAEALCEEVLKRQPDHVGALRLLAMIASDGEQYVIAEGYLRRILKIAPDSVGAKLELARFLGSRGRYPEAIDLIENTALDAGDDPDVTLLYGDMLAIVGRSADALRAYESCLAQRPDDPHGLLGCGHMLRIEGRREAAEASYRRCAELHPEMGDAWWNLSSLHGFKATDTEVETMQAELGRGELPPESAVAFHFALARAMEGRERYAEAWRHYQEGNALKRGLVKYDPVETELQQQKIRDAFGAAIFSREKATTPAAVTPIFIVGMPRSGSTLVEQILASHSQVQGAGELPYVIMMSNALVTARHEGQRYPEVVADLDAEGLTGLGRSYLHHASTHNAAGKAYFTDKMPANFSHAGFIRLMLPHAKIIDARREPMATCVANYRQLFAQGKNQSYDLVELGEYYLQYVAMMDHWRTVMPGSVLRVDYEAVVADVEAQVRRILEFCGLPFEQACVDFHRSARPVNTASSEQVRQPIYDSAVEFWRYYEPYLEELREVLAPVLR